MPEIRAARREDAAGIAAIWNDVIRNTPRTFNSVEKTVAEIEALIAARQSGADRFFVATIDGKVVGFVTSGPFRSGIGYAHTREHTIHMLPEARGRGLGKRLMSQIEQTAREAGVHSMFAGVSGENPEGVDFHRKLGYREAARLREVGYKYRRWFDLVLLQKFL
ncbi:MAG: GNAT family N-acetyltransferase [Paracoccaceae bacterium]